MLSQLRMKAKRTDRIGTTRAHYDWYAPRCFLCGSRRRCAVRDNHVDREAH